MEQPKGYWVIQCQEITDSSAMQKYSEAWIEIADEYGAKFVAGAKQTSTVEGPNIPRVLVVEFRSYQVALDCYYSEKYQKAKEFAQKAIERTFSIVEGV